MIATVREGAPDLETLLDEKFAIEKIYPCAGIGYQFSLRIVQRS
jgi:hypothetical protein